MGGREYAHFDVDRPIDVLFGEGAVVAEVGDGPFHLILVAVCIRMWELGIALKIVV